MNGKYDVKIKGYFYMITIYDCKSKQEVRKKVKDMYGKCKIDYVSKKITY
jgi:hypothetical protein